MNNSKFFLKAGIAAALTLCLIFAQAGMAANGTVNYNTSYQLIEDFGGAAVYDTPQLASYSQREAVYDLLFRDLGLDIVRIRNTYGYPDSGSSLTATKSIIAAAKKAGRNPSIKTELVPWSPPASCSSGA
jgi:O-glycosyl hydrolase